LVPCLTSARAAVLPHRNGHRPRVLASTAGDLELRIPKLRAGSFFPSLLERRRRVDQPLLAVIMEAYLHGTSTRKVALEKGSQAPQWSPNGPRLRLIEGDKA